MTARRAVLLDMGASGPRARESHALSSSLTARGFAFERYGDTREVLESIASNPADVLIVDADSPWLDLREFVEAIRRDPRTARTLIVALASGDPREIPARREIALTLAKPINADEAASRLEGLVTTRQRAVTSTRELKGDLSQLPLPDLLQLLAVSRASGTLAVEGPGRRGSVVLDNGDVREVVCGPASGVKAFVRLLLFTEGAFVFTPGAPAATDKPVESTPLAPLLFEGTRQIDEIRRLRPTLPEPWVEFRRNRKPRPDGLQQRGATSAALDEVDRLLDTPRTLAGLVDGSSVPDADLLSALDVMRQAELIDVAGGSDRQESLDPAFAAALAVRLDETGKALARILLVVDGAPGANSGAVLRALGGIAGFVPAEAPMSGALSLGPVGVLVVGDARAELFAVPAERDLNPLWTVFGATAEAAVLTAVGPDRARDEAVFASEVGLPVASVQGALTAKSLADALRNVLQQLNPRR